KTLYSFPTRRSSDLGTLDDFDRMLAAAHSLGIRVIVDLVPNHSSDQHPWFQQALAAGPGSAERDRYMFREGRGPGGNEPPNNWRSEEHTSELQSREN